jgi:hypothetical protein
MAVMTPAETVLVACLHADPARLDPAALSGLRPEDWRGLVALAARQRVRPLLLRRLAASDTGDRVPPDVLAALRSDCRAIARRTLVLHSELIRILRALASDGIPVILLKGAHVATALYGDLALREMGDLDLMVRREHLVRATDVVLTLGYAAGKPFSIDRDVAASHHVSRLLKPPGRAVELHWNLARPRRPFSIDPSSLWDRAVPVRVPGADALALSNEDLLLHLCLHTSYHHGFEFGLRSVCDIAQLLRQRGHDFNWDVVRERAEQWRWQRGVELTLEIGRRVLGAAIPPHVVRARGEDTFSEEVVTLALSQLLAGYDSTLPTREMAALDWRKGLRANVRQVVARIAVPHDVLARLYPDATARSIAGALLSLRQCVDLVRRHTRRGFRLWVRRDRRLLAARERQRLLRAYLHGS